MSGSVRAEVWRRAQTGHFETWQGYAQNGVHESHERASRWRTILDHIEGRAPIRPAERILDIGCGIDTVLDFVPGARGVAMDSLMARLAPLGLSAAARQTAGLCEALPFRSKSFDRVFLMNVLDHVRGPLEGLTEIARVLRPEGVLVLSVDTFRGRRYVQKRAHKFWSRVRGARTKHPFVFSNESAARLLCDAGFDPGEPSGFDPAKQRRTLFTARRVG